MGEILIHSNSEYDIYFLGFDISREELRVQLRIKYRGIFEGRSRKRFYIVRSEGESNRNYHVLVHKKKIELPKTLCSLIDTVEVYTHILKAREIIEQNTSQV